MYLAARAWGVQPSEFWSMSFGEWLLEAHHQWLESEDGRLWQKKQVWMEDADLTREEWRAKYGLA
ncbi:MAG: hypothetical protein OEZ19_00075 [Paracoccaceae bacterium]|nr:hypothetical protein [Paracoccaceae bacterium]